MVSSWKNSKTLFFSAQPTTDYISLNLENGDRKFNEEQLSILALGWISA